MYETIYKQTVRANQIIEDVLKLSRQQKPNQIFIEPCSWLATFLKDNFKDHDVFLHCETDNCFLFDPHHLEQVLTNLIKNGLRFCSRSHPHAFVTLEVYHDARFVYIDVIDTGAGVAEHHIQDLFNPFLPQIMRVLDWVYTFPSRFVKPIMPIWNMCQSMNILVFALSVIKNLCHDDKFSFKMVRYFPSLARHVWLGVLAEVCGRVGIDVGIALLPHLQHKWGRQA